MPCRPLAARTASNTLTVPTTLTRAPSGGSARTNGTCSAARWITWVIPCSSNAPLQLGQVGDVAAHLGQRLELVGVEQQPQPVVAAAEVVGDHAAAVVEQLADGPGADAAVGAGDQVPLVGAHAGTGVAASRPRLTVPDVEIAEHVLHRVAPDARARRRRVPGDVRREQRPRRREQRRVLRQRLGREHVERRAAEPAVLERRRRPRPRRAARRGRRSRAARRAAPSRARPGRSASRSRGAAGGAARRASEAASSSSRLPAASTPSGSGGLIGS